MSGKVTVDLQTAMDAIEARFVAHEQRFADVDGSIGALISAGNNMLQMIRDQNSIIDRFRARLVEPPRPLEERQLSAADIGVPESWWSPAYSTGVVGPPYETLSEARAYHEAPYYVESTITKVVKA